MNDTKKSSGVKCSNSEFIHGIFRDLAPGVMNGGCTIPGDPDNAKAWLARQGCAGFAECNNNYTSLSAFYAKPGERFSAKSSQCSAVYALLLDDIGTKVSYSRLGNFKLSWLLETSPDNYQGGIIFAEPVSPDCARTLNQALIRDNFCDPGATSPATRWARLPVGVNGKAKYRDEAGNPFRCRLAEWRPECRYTPAEILEGLQINETVNKPATVVTPSMKGRPFSVTKLRRATNDISNARQGDRRAAVIKHCLRASELIHAGGASFDSMVTMFAKAGEGNGIGRKEIEDILQWAIDKKKDEYDARQPRDEAALYNDLIKEGGL